MFGHVASVHPSWGSWSCADNPWWLLAGGRKVQLSIQKPEDFGKSGTHFFFPDSHSDGNLEKRSETKSSSGSVYFKLVFESSTVTWTWIRRSCLSARIPAGIISISPPEPIKSLKLLIPLLTSAFFFFFFISPTGAERCRLTKSFPWIKKLLSAVLNASIYFQILIEITFFFFTIKNV